MKNIFARTEDGKVFIELKKEYYKRDAVFAAAHKLTDRFIVFIEPTSDDSVGICIEPKKGVPIGEGELEDAVSEFCNEAVDQHVRLCLERDYGPLRELIVKQAFAPISPAALVDAVKALRTERKG